MASQAERRKNDASVCPAFSQQNFAASSVATSSGSITAHVHGGGLADANALIYIQLAAKFRPHNF